MNVLLLDSGMNYYSRNARMKHKRSNKSLYDILSQPMPEFRLQIHHKKKIVKQRSNDTFEVDYSKELATTVNDRMSENPQAPSMEAFQEDNVDKISEVKESVASESLHTQRKSQEVQQHSNRVQQQELFNQEAKIQELQIKNQLVSQSVETNKHQEQESILKQNQQLQPHQMTHKQNEDIAPKQIVKVEAPEQTHEDIKDCKRLEPSEQIKQPETISKQLSLQQNQKDFNLCQQNIGIETQKKPATIRIPFKVAKKRYWQKRRQQRRLLRLEKAKKIHKISVRKNFKKILLQKARINKILTKKIKRYCQ